MKLSSKKASAAHGVLLMALMAFAAFYISEIGWVKSLSLSPLIVGIILGMIYANSLRNHLPETWVPGIKLCTKQILRWGIILYGFRLTFQDVFAVGAPALIVDTIIVVGVLAVGIAAGRLLGLDRDTTLMVSTGSSICGAAAVLGAEPVVKCAPYKTAIAVSTVVIFGTLSMFLYPILYRAGALDLTDQQMAIYTGSTLHEVAHVVGAGNAMDPDGALHLASTATITKMIRVMMLAPVLVIMAFALSRSRKSSKGGEGASRKGCDMAAGDTATAHATATKSKIAIPWFAFGFIAAIAVNSLLQSIGTIPAESLKTFTGGVEVLDTFMLTMAMTALGAETSFDKFKQAGAKPFALAAVIYIFLTVGGYFITRLIA